MCTHFLSSSSMASSKTTQNYRHFTSNSSSYSSSINMHLNQLDVFFSFYRREEEEKGEGSPCKNFTDNLYRALRQAGIQAFKDDSDLKSSPDKLLGLKSVIERSRTSIVVFTKRYAYSTQCLEELEKMIECKRRTGQLILPVFYDVDPSHVRRQTGSFGEAIAKHEESSVINEMDLKKKVENWRNALKETANLSGWDLRDIAQGHESKFIQKIVQNVLREVRHKGLTVALHPVGIDSRVEDVISLLNIGSEDVRMIGIYGMGGIGKTTVAKAVYNSISHLFEGSCFLKNVKEVSEQPNGLLHLQEQLLSGILGVNSFSVGSIHRGNNLIKEGLRTKRVLIVLDDVDQVIQFNSLVGPHHWFGSGSRVIITTRDVHLTEQVDESYKARELDNDESLELFHWHAFGEKFPLEDYVELSENIVEYTGGLPLALEVLGSYLCGRTIIEWKSAWQKLQKVPNNDILEMLRISFDALGSNDLKVIFLDIACFFIGRNIYETIKILNACGFSSEYGINVLIQRCLLRTTDEHELRMHDLVRDMGREIIRQESPKEPGERSRLWSYEDVYDVLKNCKGTKAIEGLILDLPESVQLHLNPMTFADMYKLRLLQINNVHLTGSFEHIFQELKWFCWHYCHLKSLPADFCPEKLVFLDLEHSDLNSLWNGTVFLTNLKTLNLKDSKCLTATPDFTGVPSLEKLILLGCNSLFEVHPSIGRLGNLTYLDVSDCSKLTYLPNSICKLRSLEHLYLGGCSNLERLPEELGNMERLSFLYVDRTSIKQLPDSTYILKNLRDLSMRGCNKSLSAISWFSTLPSRLLTPSDSTMRFLLPSISRLSTLECLDLRYCNLTDEDIPHDFGNLSLLRMLNLAGNKFRSLPSSFRQLSSLMILTLGSCRSLQSIPELPPNLQYLHAHNCTSLEKLPNLSKLKLLRDLRLPNCSRLEEIQGLEDLISIQSIRLDGCNNLATAFENGLLQGCSERVVNCKIYFPRREIPAWFNIQTMGSSISFDLPLNKQSGDFLVGMILWVAYVLKGKSELRALVKNETKGTMFRDAGVQLSRSAQVNSWVSYLSKPYGMKGGDRITISIVEDPCLKVEKFGVHLVYKAAAVKEVEKSSCITGIDGDEVGGNDLDVHVKRGRDVDDVM